MLTRITSLLLFFFSFLGFSQNYTVEGVAKDEKKLPIPFANVVLVDAENNDILSGTITDDNGYFKFSDLKSKSYTLTISFVGFNKN